MVLINLLSVIAYTILCIKSIKNDKLEVENKKYKTTMRIFGGIFVFVSMYRSIFVCSYPNRLVRFDTMANSRLIIRFFATFAEISFASLVALPLIHLNKTLPLKEGFATTKIGNFFVTKTPYILICCICLAQCFAYSGLFTQYEVLFAIEESLWGFSFLLIIPCVLCHLRNINKNYKDNDEMKLIKICLTILCVYTIGYSLYQMGYALPFNYYAKLSEDALRSHLGFAEGFKKGIV